MFELYLVGAFVVLVGVLYLCYIEGNKYLLASKEDALIYVLLVSMSWITIIGCLFYTVVDRIQRDKDAEILAKFNQEFTQENQRRHKRRRY